MKNKKKKKIRMSFIRINFTSQDNNRKHWRLKGTILSEMIKLALQYYAKNVWKSNDCSVNV